MFLEDGFPPTNVAVAGYDVMLYNLWLLKVKHT